MVNPREKARAKEKEKVIKVAHLKVLAHLHQMLLRTHVAVRAQANLHPTLANQTSQHAITPNPIAMAVKATIAITVALIPKSINANPKSKRSPTMEKRRRRRITNANVEETRTRITT
jgi:hypothetical protein